MTSVRELRRALAAALAQASRPKEALDQLEAALTERGAVPTAAELYLASGELHQALGDTGHAFQAYVNSVTDDPASSVSALAAARLLEAGSELAAGSQAATAVQAAVAGTRKPAPAVLFLGGRLLHLAGDLDEARAMLERALAGQLADQTAVVDELIDVLLESERLGDARRAVDRYKSCSPEAEGWLLLEEGRFDQALSLADQVSLAPGPDWPNEAVRMLALVGLGRPADALASAGPVTGSVNAQFARLVAHLAQREYDTSQEVGEQVARSVGTEPIALVIRAQILLEKAGIPVGAEQAYETIEEARRSFERIRRAAQAGRPDAAVRALRHRWMRLQGAVRAKDDRFQYAMAEATVALDTNPARRRAAVAGCRLIETTIVQDAAARELAVQVLDPSLDSPGEQAKAYRTASAALDQCGQIELARERAQRAVELAPTPQSRCDLADVAWRSSHLSVPADKEPAQLEHLQAALRLLGHGDPFPAELSSRAAYLHGLLLARLAELGGDSGWQSLPYLLAASLAADDSYRWINLATALGENGARASAWACSQRSSTMEPGDPYATDPFVVERYLISEVNHLGDHELATRLIANVGEETLNVSWCSSVLLATALGNGREAEARDLLARPHFEGSWARWLVLKGQLLYSGMRPDSDEMVAFVADLSASDTDLETLAEARRILGQFDAADEAITQASQQPEPLRPRFVAEGRAKTALARDLSADAEAILAGQLAEEISPFQLLQGINVDLPLLERSVPAVGPAVGRLRRVAESRLRELTDSPAPSTADFALASDSTGHAALTRRLLEIVDLELSGDLATLADRVNDLGAGLVATDRDDLLPAVLDNAHAAVAGRVVQAVTGQLLNRALAGAEAVGWADRIERWSGVLEDSVLRRERVAAWWAIGDGDRRASYKAVISDEVHAPVAAELLAERFVSRAVTGDLTGACEAYRAGLEFGGTGPLDDWVAKAVTSAQAYPPVAVALDFIEGDGTPTTESRDAVAATRLRLTARLNELLGLESPAPARVPEPLLPIRVELGTDLVPLVDPSQDDNFFIGQLIPQLKDRVFETFGVRTTGIRLRPDYALPADGFILQIDEVPVARGSIPLDRVFWVRAADAADFLPAGDAAAEARPHLTRFHPLTSETGLWAITSNAGPAGACEDSESELLTPAQLLAHAIERALRPRLARFVGPQEVSDLVDEWSRIAEGDEVAAVVPDQDARLALTWVLQAAVQEGLSIRNWSVILAAIRDAGGVQAPRDVLVDAVRSRLSRDFYNAAGLPRVKVPADLEEALLGGAEPGAGLIAQARFQLMTWVRQRTATSGPLLMLITSNPAACAAVGAIVGAEFESVVTVCETDRAS